MEQIITSGQSFTSEQKNTINTLWKAKLQDENTIINSTLNSEVFSSLSSYDKIKLAQSFKGCKDYVRKEDDVYVKAKYNKCQILIYLTLYGPYKLAYDINGNEDTMWSSVIKNEWMNILANGKNTEAYNRALSTQDSNGRRAALESIANSINETNTTNKLNGIKVQQINDTDYNALSDGNFIKEGNSINRTYGIYHLPNLAKNETDENQREDYSKIEDVITSGDMFIENGNNDTIDSTGVQELSSSIYNVLLVAGIIIAVIIGAIIGIKFMLGSVEEKADIKQVLIPYIIGCIVVFGAFAIWKLAVTIFAGM